MNREYMKANIMEQNRHMFIYGYNTKEREEFLKEMVQEYPFAFDSERPIGIYFKNLGLPVTEISEDLDKFYVSIFHKNYCHFEMALKMLEDLLTTVDSSILLSRQEELINKINYYFTKQNIINLEEFKKLIIEAKDECLSCYNLYIEHGILKNYIENCSIDFFEFDMFMKHCKRMLNFKSHFAMILDYQDPVSNYSQKVVNNYLSSRCNGDISIKLVCEPDAWKTFYNQNGDLVEFTHDYGTIDLDDSNREYVKRLMQKHQI